MTSMQEEHKELLRANKMFLVDNLTDVDGVLNYLEERKIFKAAMTEEIKVPRTRRGKVAELLNRLPRRGPRAFPAFLEALRVCEETSCAQRLQAGAQGSCAQRLEAGAQGSCAQRLEAGAQGEAAKGVPPPTHLPPTKASLSDMTMQEEHVGLLRSNIVFFTENLTEVDGVLDFLVEKKICSEAHVENIQAASTRRRKIRELLDLLPRRGPRAFQTFVEALRVCEESECAKRLDGGARGAPQPVQASPDVEEEELPDSWPVTGIIPGEMELVKCQEKPSSRTLMEKAIKKGKVYPMLSQKRGYCYIVNNDNFSQGPSRKGTEKDCDGLDKLFSQLGFITVIKHDLTASDMDKFLEEAAEEDHSKSDCLVVFLLSHGEEGAVLGVDGEPVSIRALRKRFSGEGCPSMAGKPKLIFIQACQGTEKDEGVARSMTSSQPSDSVLSSQVSEESQSLEVCDAVGESKDARDTHMLRVLATHPGIKAWRGEHYGTWFIQAIIYVFKTFSHQEDLNGMMTMVNQLVNKAETSRGVKQASWFSNSLVKKFYFFPGLYREGDELKEYSPGC